MGLSRKKILAGLGVVAPGLAARFAARHFRSVQRFPLPEFEKKLEGSGARLSLPHGLFALRWGITGPVVLLVHGWSGRGTQLGAFVPALLKAGYSVVSLDSPGHGHSPGSHTDLGEISRAIQAVQKAVGDFFAVITHSFGGVATTAAISQGLRVQKMVLIGVPCTIEEIFENYGKFAELPPKVFSRFKALGEARAGWKAEDVHLGRMLCEKNIPTLVVHDKGDREVPIWQAERTIAAHPGATPSFYRRLGPPPDLERPVGGECRVKIFGPERKMMKHYELLLFDLDDTVVEFTRARRDCFVRTAEELAFGADGQVLYEAFCVESDRLWAAHREGTVSLDDVRSRRFAKVLEKSPVDPAFFTETFYRILKSAQEEMPGATAALRSLAKKYRLAGISNGRRDIQAERLRGLGVLDCFEFLLGPEDCGFAKPHPALFLATLEKAGVAKAAGLVVGDGLETDIEGACRLGLDSFWLNLEGRSLNNGDPTPTYEGPDLGTLVSLLQA